MVFNGLRALIVATFGEGGYLAPQRCREVFFIAYKQPPVEAGGAMHSIEPDAEMEDACKVDGGGHKERWNLNLVFMVAKMI